MADPLIYDRTAKDVADRTPKGYWNATDIERVNGWMSELSVEYGITYTPLPESLGDRITTVQIDEFLDELETLRTGRVWSTTPPVPIATYWNWQKINAVERIIADIAWRRQSWLDAQMYCGTIVAGQSVPI